MPDEVVSRPFALFPLAVVYLFSLLITVSSYGYPYPFMGTFYQGRGADCFVFADSMVCLYLVIGILKRQRLTAWLLIATNLLDICNACINLALIPSSAYAKLAGAPVPPGEPGYTTLAAAVVLMLLNVYVFTNVHHFNNKSPYLF